MDKIDWNKASELGLIQRINSEVLHPLGLAMFRDPEDGTSGGIFVAPDKRFQYGPSTVIKKVLSKDEIHDQINTVD